MDRPKNLDFVLKLSSLLDYVNRGVKIGTYLYFRKKCYLLFTNIHYVVAVRTGRRLTKSGWGNINREENSKPLTDLLQKNQPFSWYFFKRIQSALNEEASRPHNANGWHCG